MQSQLDQHRLQARFDFGTQRLHLTAQRGRALAYAVFGTISPLRDTRFQAGRAIDCTASRCQRAPMSQRHQAQTGQP
ncbi:hypothetical protein XaFJ1_GM001713 [Xanthomonas albilineans]|nr:hypothetical protein XaFJ1_GM001713 [Xanthomonas albilineans]